MADNYKQIKDEEQLAEVLNKEEEVLCRYAFQCVDFKANTELALSHTYHDCLFIDCRFPKGLKRLSKDCIFLPDMGRAFRYHNWLYTPEELYEGYDYKSPESYKKCYDGIVYKHYIKMGKHPRNVRETLARSLHDHSISDCLQDYLSGFNEHKLIGVMGGHSISRAEDSYEKIVHMSKRLTEDGYLMITGGGPGDLEAWMAGRSEEEVQDALAILRRTPLFTDKGWLETAWEVHEKYPQHQYQSLGVPTWLYGHEPSTPFATQIAKYFDNSIRAAGILRIATGGIVYTPGSPGTLQELLQDAVQNHHLIFG